jgi:hypothetical protein
MDSTFILNKFEIIGLPAQFGKTKMAIEIIENHISQDEEIGKSLHIIFTQNTHTNQTQFMKRVLHKFPVTDITSMGSQKFKDIPNHVFSVKDLFFDYSQKKMNPILVCCSNSVQFKKIQDFLAMAQNITIPGEFNRVFIYIDEFHDTFKMAGKTLMEFERNKLVCKIYGLSATPINHCMDFHYDTIDSTEKLRKLITELKNYMFFDDYYLRNIDLHCEAGHTHIDPKYVEKNPNEYAIKVLDTPAYYNDFFAPGKYTFVPSMFHTKYHIELKDFILNKSETAVVFVLNGHEKKMFYREHQLTYERNIFEENEVIEFSEKMLILLERYKLRENRNYFVTGYNCISLGITLCNPKIGHFTGSIIYHLSNEVGTDDLANLYQISARTAGFMKHWKSFKKYGKTKIFCPTFMFQQIIKSERKAADYILEGIRKIPQELISIIKSFNTENSQASASSEESQNMFVLQNLEQEVVLQNPEQDVPLNHKKRKNGNDESIGKKSRNIDTQSSSEPEIYSESTVYEKQVKRILIKYKVFNTEENAIDFIKETFLNNNMKRYKKSVKFHGTRCSPMKFTFDSDSDSDNHLVGFKECLGKSIDEIVAMKIGISNTTKYRKVYSQVDKRWVVYWRL